MNARVLWFAGLSAAVSAILMLGACHKKTAAVAAPVRALPAPADQPWSPAS